MKEYKFRSSFSSIFPFNKLIGILYTQKEVHCRRCARTASNIEVKTCTANKRESQANIFHTTVRECNCNLLTSKRPPRVFL